MPTIKNTHRKESWKKALITLGFLIIVTPSINYLMGRHDMFTNLQRFLDYSLYGYIISMAFWLSNWWLGSFTGKKLNWYKKPKQSNIISLLSYVLLGLMLSLLVPYFYLKYYEKVPQEYFFYRVLVYGFIALAIDLIIVSFFYSSFLTKYWLKSIQNEEALKRENLVAKYESLKNQVNPHFLFNTLNTLTGVVEKMPEKASEYVSKLSTIYRYVLEQTNKDLVPLQDEIEFIDDYIYLSKIRYGNGLIVKKELEPEGILIIPMAMQLLVENAIKHNVVSLESPLKIELYMQEKFLCVKNNYQPKTSMQKTNKVGLENLTKRYEYVCAKKVEVTKNDSFFEVRIPIVKTGKE